MKKYDNLNFNIIEKWINENSSCQENEGFITDLEFSDYKKLNQWMLDQFNKHNVNILDVFHCPHGSESNCDCRKPKPGMLLKAKDKYNLNMEKSWMIGDTEADIKAANSCWIKNTILVRSGHKIDEPKSKAKFILNSIKESIQIIT